MMRSAFGLRQAVIETPDGIAAAGCDGWAGRWSVSARSAWHSLNRARLDIAAGHNRGGEGSDKASPPVPMRP